MQNLDKALELQGRGKLNKEISEAIGLSEPRVSNLLRIAKHAEPEWLYWVHQRKLSLKHIEAVLKLPARVAEDLLRKAIAYKWTAQKLRDEVRVKKGGRAAAAPHQDADVAHLETQLTEMLATPVRIVTQDRGGELRIRFTDSETLEGVLERLGWRAD